MSKLEDEIVYTITTYSINGGVVKKLKEITEQECIGFAEWCDNFGWRQVLNSFWKSPNNNAEIHSKELFQLYQKSKENG